MAASIRSKLIEVLKTFDGVFMLTLTLDPEPFKVRHGVLAAEEAHKYVMEKRCIARLVQALVESGQLTSRRYFVVTEFHENGFPHWHVLVESKRVDHHILRQAWDSFRPKWAGPVNHANGCDCPQCGGLSPVAKLRPAFGAVKFSAPKFESPMHAAFYATKYLTKQPSEGWPAWVLASPRRIRRVSTSRGFWPKDQREKPRRAESEQAELDGRREKRLRGMLEDAQGYVEHSVECFCEFCRNAIQAREDIKPKPRKNIGERMLTCGDTCTVVEIVETTFDDGEVHDERRFVVHVPVTFDQMASYFHERLEPGQTRIRLRPWSLRATLNTCGWEVAQLEDSRRHKLGLAPRSTRVAA
ncbi:MAG: hypothetical protein K8T25_07130 [Planctomycetia bacterium]|nr:hypothetical protein [Planctomycetia bacterium]